MLVSLFANDSVLAKEYQVLPVKRFFSSTLPFAPVLLNVDSYVLLKMTPKHQFY